MKKILIDSSSAILLFKAGLYDNLTRLFDTCIAETVFHELTVDGRDGAEVFRACCMDGRVRVLNKKSEEDPSKAYPDFSFLGGGERETIREYILGSGQFIIIDDYKGARFCRDNAIPYINALLTPRVLFFSGDISEEASRSGAEAILRLGRYSRKIIDYAMSRERDDLSFFLP